MVNGGLGMEGVTGFGLQSGAKRTGRRRLDERYGSSWRIIRDGRFGLTATLATPWATLSSAACIAASGGSLAGVGGQVKAFLGGFVGLRVAFCPRTLP